MPLIKSHELFLDNRRKKLHRKLNSLVKTSMKQGMAFGISELDELFRDFENILEKADNFKIKCTIDCARTLTQEYLNSHPQAVVTIAIKVLKNIAEHTDVEILASPHDAEILKHSLGEIALACTSARKVNITKDHSMTLGSILVKANKSIIDASIDTQLAKAKEILKI